MGGSSGAGSSAGVGSGAAARRARLFRLGRQARGFGQRRDRRAQVGGQVGDVGHGLVVAVEAEEQLAVVAHDRDAQSQVLGQRDHRLGRHHAPPEQVERVLRSGHVGDHEVDEALARLQPRGLGHDRRRREVREAGEHGRAHGLARLLELAHLGVHQREGLDRVLAPHRQRGPHRGDLVAEGAALGVGAHGDRHHGLERELVGREGAVAQPAAERERDDAEHDVVDRAAEDVLDRLEALELGLDPVEAPVGRDRHVQRGTRGGVDAAGGQRPHGGGVVDHAAHAPGVARGAPHARRARSRSAGWRARPAPRPAAGRRWATAAPPTGARAARAAAHRAPRRTARW